MNSVESNKCKCLYTFSIAKYTMSQHVFQNLEKKNKIKKTALSICFGNGASFPIDGNKCKIKLTTRRKREREKKSKLYKNKETHYLKFNS